MRAMQRRMEQPPHCSGVLGTTAIGYTCLQHKYQILRAASCRVPVTPDSGRFDLVLQVTQLSEAVQDHSLTNRVWRQNTRLAWMALVTVPRVRVSGNSGYWQDGARPPVTLTTDCRIHVESRRAHLARPSQWEAKR